MLNIRLPITIAALVLALLLGGWLALTLGGESSPVQLPWFGLPIQCWICMYSICPPTTSSS